MHINHSLITQLIFFAWILTACFSASADPNYRYKISLEHDSIDYDSKSGFVGGERTKTEWTLYFNAVNTEQGPLSASDFLSKSSYVLFGYEQGDYDFKNSVTTDADERTTSVGLHYVTRDDIFLSLDWNNREFKWRAQSRLFNVKTTTRSRQATLGYYLKPNLAAAITREERETTRVDVDADRIGFMVRWLTPVSTKKWLDLSIIYSDEEETLSSERTDTSVTALGIDFFFTRRTSAGILIALAESDDRDKEAKLYAYSIEHFIKPGIAFRLTWFDTQSEIDENSHQVLNFDLNFRF